MDFLAANFVELILGFASGLIGNTLAAAFQNKHEGRNPGPCARSGAVGGVVLGVVAVIFIIVQKIL